MVPMAGVLLVGTLTNVGLTAASRGVQVGDLTIGGVLLVDVALLTVVLAISGGPANPFSVLFLFPVTVGALLLPSLWTWGLVGATAAAYGSLFLVGSPAAHVHDPGAMGRHLAGMFAAYSLTGPLVAVAVMKIRAALDDADRRTSEAHELQAQNEKLAALATLAAGAAHELATPLSTILLVSGELRRRMDGSRDSEDLALIREEVERCREILSHLSADAGSGAGEAPVMVDAETLVRQALVGSRYPPVDVKVEGVEPVSLCVPPRLMTQVIRRLLGNARDASGPDAPIVVRVREDHGSVLLAVEDQGEGMDRETLRRAAEPFFSTKPHGEGRGLGLYFVRSVANHLGGDLSLISTAGQGTVATVRLPLVVA